jgi:hypothetical protein
MRYIIFLVSVFLVAAASVKADPYLFGPKKHTPLIKKVYGTVSLGDGIGLSACMYTRGNNLYTLRYLHEDRSTSGAPFWESSPKTHLDEIGLMYGKGFDVWRFFFNGSAGAAYVNFNSDANPPRLSTAGLIGNLQASYALRPWMAIGVELYGDLNIYQTRTGFLVNLQFGKVRWKKV